MSDRTFSMILDGKKGGLVKGSTPLSAAKKAYKKLLAQTGKSSLKFELKETTKDSKKKVYGPYKGCLNNEKIKIKMMGGRKIQEEEEEENNRVEEGIRTSNHPPAAQHHTRIPNDIKQEIIELYGTDAYEHALRTIYELNPHFTPSNVNSLKRILYRFAQSFSSYPANIANAYAAARAARKNVRRTLKEDYKSFNTNQARAATRTARKTVRRTLSEKGYKPFITNQARAARSAIATSRAAKTSRPPSDNENIFNLSSSLRNALNKKNSNEAAARAARDHKSSSIKFVRDPNNGNNSNNNGRNPNNNGRNPNNNGNNANNNDDNNDDNNDNNNDNNNAKHHTYTKNDVKEYFILDASDLPNKVKMKRMKYLAKLIFGNNNPTNLDKKYFFEEYYRQPENVNASGYNSNDNNGYNHNNNNENNHNNIVVVKLPSSIKKKK